MESKQDLKKLTNEISKIHKRNRKVELDKKWETSTTRRIFICILTYIIVLIYSYLVKNYNSVFLTSIVPVIGFALSTLSLKYIRKIWERKLNKN